SNGGIPASLPTTQLSESARDPTKMNALVSDRSNSQSLSALHHPGARFLCGYIPHTSCCSPFAKLLSFPLHSPRAKPVRIQDVGRLRLEYLVHACVRVKEVQGSP